MDAEKAMALLALRARCALTAAAFLGAAWTHFTNGRDEVWCTPVKRTGNGPASRPRGEANPFKVLK
jgi:hypothetical protein